MKKKQTIDLRGPNGNVYAVIGTVIALLKGMGEHKLAAQFKLEAFNQRSYESVLLLVKEYVDVEFIR